MDYNNIDYTILLSSYKVDENWPSTSQINNIINKNGYEDRIDVVR
jgi:hypothetical protein